MFAPLGVGGVMTGRVSKLFVCTAIVGTWFALDAPSAVAGPPVLVCPHAIGTVPLLPPDDRPTTADCHIDTAGLHVPLNTPDIRIDVSAGASLFTVSTRGHLLAVTDSHGTDVPAGFGRLTSFDDPSGAHVGVSYDAAARIVQLSAPQGIINFAYSHDLLVSINAPIGGLRSFVYDSAGELTGIVDADGLHTLSYDQASHVSQVSGAAVTRNAAAAVTSAAGATFVYDPAGRLTSATFGGSTTAFAYDPASALTSMSAQGVTWTYTRNALGQGLAVSDGAHIWTFTYDAAQRLIGATAPTGAVTQRSYDARGDLATILDGSGVTSFTRNANRSLIRVAYPDATAAAVTYTRPAAQMVCPHAFLGASSAPEDDLATTADCFIAVIGGIAVRLDGSFSLDGPLNLDVASFRLSSSGALTGMTNGRGDRAQIMGGDVLASITAPTGTAAAFVHTAAGLPASVTDAVGSTTQYTYDVSGRLTAAVDALNGTTHFAWIGDRLLSITGPDAQAVVSFTYDSGGRLLSATDGLGAITSLLWSAAGLVSIHDPVGNVTIFTYDGNGRLLSASTPFGATINYTHDGAGDLTSATDALGRVWSYQHDAAGLLTRYVDGNGNTVLFAYSADGVLISETNQLSQATTYTHNASGDFLSITNPVGAITQFAYNSNRSTTAILDPIGRVTAFAYGDVSAPVITVPSPITVDATGPAGAIVNYSATASDPDDVSVSLSCTPVSGSTFPIAVTTVSCQASDAAGNSSTAAFTVTVRGASAQIEDLTSAVVSLNVAKGLTTALLAKLAAATAALAVGDTSTACSAMADFIAQVHAKTGKDISSAQADELIAAAVRIRSVIGC